VRFLLERGADVNARDDEGCTALMSASLDSVRLLVENGADINARNSDGETAATKASGNITSVNNPWRQHLLALLDMGADVNAARRSGHTILMSACWRGDLELVRVLLDRGADVNARTGNGYTALMDACNHHGQNPAHGHTEIVRALLEKGADPNVWVTQEYDSADQTAHFGMSPLERAARDGNIEMVQMMLKRGAKVRAAAFMHAIGQNRAIARMLLNKLVDVNGAFFEDWETPLMSACAHCDIEMVRGLIKKGALVKTKSYRGNTALMKACGVAAPDVVRALLDNGAEVNAETDNGWTALICATLSDRPSVIEVVRMLLNRGADVNARTYDNRTPLGNASRHGNQEVMRALREKGARE